MENFRSSTESTGWDGAVETLGRVGGLDDRAGDAVRTAVWRGKGRFADRPGRIGPIGAGEAFEAKANVLAPLFVADLDEKFGLAKADFRRLNASSGKRRKEQATVFLANGRKVYGNLAGQQITKPGCFSIQFGIAMLPGCHFAVVRLDCGLAALQH